MTDEGGWLTAADWDLANQQARYLATQREVERLRSLLGQARAEIGRIRAQLDAPTARRDSTGQVTVDWPDDAIGALISRELLDQLIDDANRLRGLLDEALYEWAHHCDCSSDDRDRVIEQFRREAAGS